MYDFLKIMLLLLLKVEKLKKLKKLSSICNGMFNSGMNFDKFHCRRATIENHLTLFTYIFNNIYDMYMCEQGFLAYLK